MDFIFSQSLPNCEERMKGIEFKKRQELFIREHDLEQLSKYKAGEIKDNPSIKEPFDARVFTVT